MEIVKTTNDEWHVGNVLAFRDDASPTPNRGEKKSFKLIRNIRHEMMDKGESKAVDNNFQVSKAP